MRKMISGPGITFFLYMAPARIPLAIHGIQKSVKYNIAYCSMDTQAGILLILLELALAEPREISTLRCAAANLLAEDSSLIQVIIP